MIAKDTAHSHMLPQTIGTMLAMSCLPAEITTGVNFGTAFYLWWSAPAHRRTVYKMKPETAEQIRAVGLSFIPETPPVNWQNGVIVIESTNPAQPLFRDFFSVCAYFVQDKNANFRYFFAGLRYPDGARTFGIPADIGKVNDKLAKEQKLLDLPCMDDFLNEGRTETRTEQEEALDFIRFVFSASYYILNPGNRDYINIKRSDGPLQRDPKSGKKDKKVTPLWSYQELVINQTERSADVARGELDKTNLSLEPTIVSPHIRRIGEKIVIVDAHDSHRWRRTDIVGSMKKL